MGKKINKNKFNRQNESPDLETKMEIPSGWRSFFHQYEHKTKIVLSPCERELLGSMCCPLLLLHLRVKKTKNNPPAPPRKGWKIP